MADALEFRLASWRQLIVGHRQRQSDRNARCRGTDGLDRRPMGVDKAPSHPTRQPDIVLARREQPGVPAHGGHDVRLIDGARAAHHIAECIRDDGTKPRKPLYGHCALPAALIGEPPRGREVVEGHDRVDAACAQVYAQPAVMRECSQGDLAVSWLNPTPLDGEPVVVQTQSRDQVDVLFPAFPRITCVPGGFRTYGACGMLESPPIVVDVPALDLVCRGRRAPGEASGKRPTPSGSGHGRSSRSFCVLGSTVSLPDNGVTFLADD